MRNLFRFGTLMLMSVIIVSTYSCKDDDDATDTTFDVNINGLQDLGADFKYEGWLIVDGSPVTTGLFTVDADGVMSNSSFNVSIADLAAATKFVLTIEPSPDSDTAPSDVHILAGDFSGGTANLTVGDPAAIGDDFSTSTGGYILATPTNGDNNDEKSGVWFLDPSAGPGAALDLPTLPAGWEYEGWAVIDGTPVSTGKFTDLASADSDDSFSGTMAGPPFPGEDFLVNAPTGFTFPVDLSGKTIVISVEPSPDNSAAPFVLKPLLGSVPADAADHTLYSMDNISVNNNPTGTANR
jgi:hypothetical protein